MPATTLDGKATAAAIRAGLTERVTALTAAGRRPGPGTLPCGDGPGSFWYGGGIAGDVAPDVGEVPGHAASHPGGVGAVPRAMLLRDVVGAAGRAAAPESPSA